MFVQLLGVHSVHSHVHILYRCSATEVGQTVAMATVSIALAAGFFCCWLFSFSVCVSVCLAWPSVPSVGVSSMSTVKAVNKLGRSELGGDWPRWPGSERRDQAAWERATKQQTQRNIIQGRTNNKLTLCVSISLFHLRPFFTLACVPFVFYQCPGRIWLEKKEIRQWARVQRGREERMAWEGGVGQERRRQVRAEEEERRKKSTTRWAN